MQSLTQQKQSFITQLKLIRQDSLSEYLSSNLNSLANRQVIEDILNQFLEQNQNQFLEQISSNICEVKAQCKQLKQELKSKQQQEKLWKLRIGNEVEEKYQKQMEEFFKKWLELEELGNQLIKERSPSKAMKKLVEDANYKGKLIQEKKAIQEKLNKQLQQKAKSISSLGHDIKTLQSRINILNQRIESKDLLNKSLEQQVYQKHIKLQQVLLSNHILQEKSLKQHQHIEFLEQKLTSLQYKHQSHSKSISQHLSSISKLSQDNTFLKFQLTSITSTTEVLSAKLEELEKNYEQKKKQLQLTDKNLNKEKGKNEELQKQLIELKSKSQQFIQHLQATIHSHAQQIHSLTKKLSQSQSLSQQLKQKNLEKQHLLKSYLQNKNKQIIEIQEQMKQMKLEIQEKQQQQKQYQLYLQQIIELKQKIKHLTPCKYEEKLQVDTFGKPIKIINKRTKLYFLMCQLKNKVQYISQEYMKQVKNKVIEQIAKIKGEMLRMMAISTAHIIQKKLQCDYCDHNGKINNNNSNNNRKATLSHTKIKQKQQPLSPKSQYKSINYAKNNHSNNKGINNRDINNRNSNNKHIINLNTITNNPNDDSTDQYKKTTSKQFIANKNYHQSKFTQEQTQMQMIQRYQQQLQNNLKNHSILKPSYNSNQYQQKYHDQYQQKQYSSNKYQQKLHNNNSNSNKNSNNYNINNNNNNTLVSNNTRASSNKALLRRLNEKMSQINQQNQNYQVHLSRVLSQSQIVIQNSHSNINHNNNINNTNNTNNNYNNNNRIYY